MAHVLAGNPRDAAPAVHEVLGEALFHERSRLEHASGQRADADREFWAGVARALRHAGAERSAKLLREVVARYAGEIRGHFDARVYAVATRALPVSLSALLNGLSPAHLVAHAGDLPNLEENVVLEGEIDTLRALARVGTIILAPTHSSNLDSLLLGFAIYRMGLPPFSYGAGLNLFTNPMTSFFMHHLGAYTVDRSKTDPLYRATLKEFATVLLEHGRHNLFFPGGTRSRSGEVETHLKKGLLGTGVVAFKNNLRAGAERPRVFVVPATATYPLVLEARSLVADFLEKTGRGLYLPAVDEFNLLHRWIDFLRGLLRLRLRIRLVIGKPLDPFGNDVDAEGVSRDGRGRPVDPARYLLVDGAIGDDPERDAEYTCGLVPAVLRAYRADTVALPTAILAFAVFERLRRSAPRLDLYRLLRSPSDELTLPVAEVASDVERLLGDLRALARDGRIRVSDEAADAATVVRRGLETFGTYHPVPVIERSADNLRVGDANLVFFYRNRLEGYGLDGSRPALPPDHSAHRV
ncbi:MAG TPA: 1-acyl-sn-glycerol-3-phosphate acyltransferase [Polyangiaceae bacterium]|nr:1-acyl-sn-glycerol-3-phosphate acyltransferase [Polyangiaceae bacterium]